MWIRSAFWVGKAKPGICCQVVVDFDSRGDIDRMLASPERGAFRPTVLDATALFDGQFSHIDYEVGVS